MDYSLLLAIEKMEGQRTNSAGAFLGSAIQ